MANRSSLDPDNTPARLDRNSGRAMDSHFLGSSDSSDTGSESVDEAPQLDVAEVEDDTFALVEFADTSDREDTGERLTLELHCFIQPGADVGFDRIVAAEEVGLGGGLDQAEEAQLGITDEELEKRLRATGLTRP